jgi:dTDP-L-rhamnose 4-epimerase
MHSNRNTDKYKTCLVTGGAGFIGCALSPALARRFSRVVAMDNLHPQIHAPRERPAALDPLIELEIGDVTCADDWDRVLQQVRPEVVVHLAAETGTGQSLDESTRHAMVNVVGTTCMFDAFTRHGVVPERFVLSSSRAVYGEGCWRADDGQVHHPGQRSQDQLESGQWDFPRLHPEPFRAATTPPAPTSVYGATKLAQEHLLSAWALARGSSPRILRLQNVYGPGQSLSNPYTGIVSLFVRMAKVGRAIPLYEDGKMTRDFVLIDDVATALLSAIDAPSGGFTVDVGTGRAATIQTVAEIIARRYGAPTPEVCGKFRNGDVRHASCDIADTLQALDWTPKVNLEDGLEKLCQWIDGQASLPPL